MEGIAASEAQARLSPIELALVNAPVALFALPFAVLLPLGLSLRGAARLLFVGLAWWCASGAVMMGVELPARMARYRRLVDAAARGGLSRLARGLAETLCGLFMFWALRYRHSAWYRRSIAEGVER